MYLFEHQCVVQSVLDLSGRSPIGKFGVNGLGQEGTLDASGVHLRFDGSVDPECQPLQARASLVQLADCRYEGHLASCEA